MLRISTLGFALGVTAVAGLWASGAGAQEVPLRFDPPGSAGSTAETPGCHPLAAGVEEAFPCRRGELRTGLLWLPGGAVVAVDYELIDGQAVFEGDILLSVDEDGSLALPSDISSIFGKSTGRSDSSFYWGGGNIPYVNSLTFNPERVDAAIDHWEQKTNLVFVPRTSEANYIEFVPASGCASHVGRQGGRQEVYLADACSTGSTIHEIGHAVGLWHEHNRSDRDDSVIVHWGNIQFGREHNFETYVQRGEDGFDWGQHDFGSIMHYSSYAFSSNGLPTLTKTDGSTFSVQRSGLSGGDQSGIDKMYGLRVTISHWCTDSELTCEFTANRLQGTIPIQSYEWFFDDTPETKFGRSVTHTFSSAGEHTVEVLVFDAGGDRATAQDTVDLDPSDPCIICS